MALGRPRGCALLVALALVQATDTDADDTILAKECECCSKLNLIANEECQTAYKDAGLPENGRCKDWEVVQEPCLESCGVDVFPNCTQLGTLLYDACFPIMELVNSAEYAETTCTAVNDNYVRRCSVACADKEELCKPAPHIDGCMATCGNYRDCSCYDVEGTFVTTCDGAVQEVFLYESCFDLLDNKNLTTCIDGPCADYSVCPLNKCIVHRVECDPETECWFAGVCTPDTGECEYSAKPAGTPCDDGNPFSYYDKCSGYEFERYCAGEMDKCQQYQITCDTLNVCQAGGTCSADNGDCSNSVLPDGMKCDDGKSWTNNDQCMGGVCRGEEENLCTELYNEGACKNEPCITVTCDPREGVCLRKFLNGNADQVCGDHATCVEGRCMSPAKGKYEDIGTGYGTDEAGRALAGYYGDVGNIDKCLKACDDDPVCVGIGYSVSSSSCMVYAPNRTRAPNGERFGGHSVWAWSHGGGGVELEGAAVVLEQNGTGYPSKDVPVTMVFKRVEVLNSLNFDQIDVIFGPPGIMASFLTFLAMYSMFNRPSRIMVLQSLGCARFSCCKEYLADEEDVEGFEKSLWDDESDEDLTNLPSLEDVTSKNTGKLVKWLPGASLFRRFRRAQKAYDEEVEKAYEEAAEFEEKLEEQLRAEALEEAAEEEAAAEAAPAEEAASGDADALVEFDAGGVAASGSSYDSSAQPA